MTRSEQERLVERYLSGEMISADEEEFFMQVAVDQDLRQTLKAYRIVESAIRKHRDIAPGHHDQSRTRLIAMLSAHAAAHPTAAHLAAAHPTAAGNSAARASGGRAARRVTISTAALQWVVGSVAVFAFTLGTFIVAPLIHGTSNEPGPRDDRVGTPANVRSILPADIAMNPPMGLPTGRPAEVSAPVTGIARPTDAVAGSNVAAAAPSSASRHAAHATSEPAAVTSPKARNASRPHEARSSAELQPAPAPRTDIAPRKAASPRIVVRDSSLKVRVRVDLPKTPN